MEVNSTNQDIRYCTRCGWYNHTRRNCYSKHNRCKEEINEEGTRYCLRCGVTGHEAFSCEATKNHHGHVIKGSVSDFLETPKSSEVSQKDFENDEVK